MHRLSAKAIHELFISGKKSAEEIASYFLHRIEKYNDTLGAFSLIMKDEAIQKAKDLDAKRKQGALLGKMAGVPYAVKDNMHIKGQVTSCASKFLKHYRALFDSTVYEKLSQADAICLGKTNLDEFAMGSSNENSAFFVTKNPWDLKCSPGGSSGGSSAAVSARLVPVAFGSDTGGSIRQPAAFTGTIGFKPTYGRVSRYGLVAFASSFDQIGPITNFVEDSALAVEVISGYCERDATSINKAKEPYGDHLTGSIQGKKIGVCMDFLSELSHEYRHLFDKAIKAAKDLGAQIVDIRLNLLKYSIPMYYILATAEASTNLARYDGIGFSRRSNRANTLEEVYEYSKQEGFGEEVKRRILLGTYVLSSGYQDAYYKKAQKVRTLMIKEFQEAFHSCDIIAMPTTASSAFPLGSIKDPLTMYLQDMYTISANLAGLPAISIPCGLNEQKLPFGFQLLGNQMHDAKVLHFAHKIYEELNPEPLMPTMFNEGGSNE